MPRLSKYPLRPIDLGGLHTIPIGERGGKVRVEQFAARTPKGAPAGQWLERLPRILAADSFRALVEAIEGARRAGKPVIWGLGGHVIKCGLAPVLIDLMERGFATAFAMNGAAAIHDFEIALCGQTSEDVEAVLPEGRFGTAEETGREMNRAYGDGVRDGLGAGEALGRHLDSLAPAEFAPYSLLLAAWRRGVPVTVHIAIGADTPHTHPAADPAALGAATHHDFRLFCTLAAGLNGGGVYVNVGSAVLLPEVFLKAVSAVRNLGYPLRQFTTANLDFIQHYRPRVNVVSRPHAEAGGQGIALTGHHELMLPLLAAVLADRDPA
jgi:hypothetical protein